MKFFIECCKSKEKDTTYHALKVDFGYRVGVLTMDKNIMAEIADVKISDLFSMQVGDKIEFNISVSK